MAFFNLIRLGFGAGVLSLPLATSQAGIICGPFLNLSSGLILIHTHLLLVSIGDDVSVLLLKVC